MLLEREDLLETLRAGLSRLGELALVAGEAGAGKTSLVRAFVDELDEKTLVITGACDPLTTPRPLSPLRDFAASADAGLGSLADDGLNPMDQFEMVLDRLRHTIRPIVMVIEDIHWADDATLDFLRFVGRRVGDVRALVVCTYREDEVGSDHPLRPVLGQLLPLATTLRLAVPPLSPDAISVLSAGRDIDPRSLHQLSGGNAFFVTEVLAAGSTLPATVQDAVLARLSRLDGGARFATEVVSVAPRHMEIEKAMGMGVDSAALDRAVNAGMLLAGEAGLRFRHEIARAAVEESIPPARRLRMHRQMIGLLEEDPDRDPARLAHHAIRAADAGLIADYAPAAGDQAAGRGARREAVAFYRAALQHPEELGAQRANEVRVRLGDQLRLLDRPDEGEPLLRAAASYFREVGDTERLADTLGRLQAVLWNLQRIEEGWVVMNEALETLRARSPSQALGMTLYRAAHNHMLARHAEPAFRAAAEAAEVAAEIGDGDVAWLAELTRGTIDIVVGDAAEGAEILRASAAKAEEMGNPRFVSLALGMLGSGGGESRRYGEAISALEAGIEQGLATDEDYTVAYNRSWLARIAFEQGRWDEVPRYAELVASTTLQKEGIAYLTAMSALGRVRVRRGEAGGAELLAELVDLGRSHEIQHAWNAVCGWAEHHWLADRPRAAIEVVEPAYERALDTDSSWARGEIGFWMWRLGGIDGPPPDAAEPFALHMSGRWRESAALWRDIGCPYEEALALADGDHESKLAALAVFDRLGATPMGDRLRAELRADGLAGIPRGPRKSTRKNPAGLTGRQLEVLGLMVEGLSNAEIARRLYVSKKTVDHHVSAIYSKLGVRNRARATALALSRGLVTP